jgi:hypothetical protein
MNIIELQDRLKDLPDNALMQEMQMPTGNAPQFLVLSELKRRKRMRDEYKRQEAADMPTVAEEVVTGAGVPQEGIMGAARAMAPNTNVAQNTGMDMAAPVPATRAPQPQMMADGGVVKMRQGGVPEYAQKATMLDIVRESINSGNWSRERDQYVKFLGEDFVREAESALIPGTLGPVSMQRMEDQGIFGNSPGRNIGGEGIASVATSVEKFMPTPSYEKGTGRATMVDGTFVEVMPNGNVFDARTGKMVTGDLAQAAIAKLSPDLTGDTAAFTEFENTPSNYNLEMPTQEDLDLKAQETAAPDVFPNDVSSFDTDAAYNAAQEQRRADAARMMAINEIPTDKPTFTGDVLPFLGDASVAAGKSLYSSLFPQKTVGPDDIIAELREQEAMRNADPIQDEINRLRAIISDPEASSPEKANAAQDLQALQERIAVTQTGGNIAATVEGQGIEAPEGFVMTALGLQPDPNYKAPGKTGQSIVDQAALQGTEALGELAEAGLYPDNIIREAGKAAKLADFEAGIYDINKDVMDVQNALENPYLPDDARAEMEDFLRTAEQQKSTIATQTGVSPQLFAPDAEATPNITGGYEGLINTSPVTIAEQAAEAAEDTIDMDALTAEADEERAGYEAAAKAIQEIEKDPDAPKVPKTSGGSGGAGFGSTDSRIAKMLADRQKEAESDKWMALAYAGMELMKPTATIGEGLGKAGQAGLGYLTKSKKGLRDFETDMLKLQTQLDMANIRAASSGRSKMAPASLVTAAASRLRTAKDTLDTATTRVERQNALDAYNAALEEYNNINTFVASQYGYTPSGSTGASSSVPNLSDSANR